MATGHGAVSGLAVYVGGVFAGTVETAALTFRYDQRYLEGPVVGGMVPGSRVGRLLGRAWLGSRGRGGIGRPR